MMNVIWRDVGIDVNCWSFWSPLKYENTGLVLSPFETGTPRRDCAGLILTQRLTMGTQVSVKSLGAMQPKPKPNHQQSKWKHRLNISSEVRYQRAFVDLHSMQLDRNDYSSNTLGLGPEVKL